MWVAWGATAFAQSSPRPLSLIDVPYLSQAEDLCGGAAAAMVLRYWGARRLTSESFASLVDRSASGIRTGALIADLKRQGWNATGVRGTETLLANELAAKRPVIALIQDRPGRFHYVVVVGATEDVIVFHDPAKSPFRVMSRQEFVSRWDEASRWMAVILPSHRIAQPGDAPPGQPSTIDVSRVAASPQSPDTHGSAAAGECAEAVATGIDRARAGDLGEAERWLASAVSCRGSGALRELAGVRLLQRRWPDVSDLAEAAVSEDPHDAYAWRLLGTSAFVQDQPFAALDAWNHVQEPHVDLVRVNGLTRTRSRIIEGALGVAIGDVLTSAYYTRARRRLADVPSAATARLAYVPVPSGLVELEASVVERPVAPTRWTFLRLGVSALASREVSNTIGSLTGGGESIALRWRFWPHRPFVGGRFLAPAPWGGTWGVEASTERQSFDDVSLGVSRRTAFRVTSSQWINDVVRVSGRAGMDDWRTRAQRRLATFGGSLRLASRDDRVSGTLDGDAWRGSSAFATGGAVLSARSSTDRRGVVLLGTAGVRVATEGAPLLLWPGGDTGPARDLLLRAHPIIDEGALRVSRIGRRVTHASMEVERWWQGPVGTSLAAAGFVDTARTANRAGLDPITDVDVGIGARISVPGLPGIVRIDVGHGLRDGANAVSFVYNP